MKHVVELESMPTSTQLEGELARIRFLLEDPDYISSTPKVYSEAPKIDKAALEPAVLNLYSAILDLARPFHERSKSKQG